jgi:hypothetical protein
MPLKLDPIEDGRLRARCSVTATPDEHDIDAITRGLREMWAAIPETHRGHRFYIDWECDRRGRESSRRIFLTLICEPRP